MTALDCPRAVGAVNRPNRPNMSCSTGFMGVNQLSAAWAHYLLKKKVKTEQAVEKHRFEFLLRQIGRYSTTTPSVVTAPLYEEVRNTCGY